MRDKFGEKGTVFFRKLSVLATTNILVCCILLSNHPLIQLSTCLYVYLSRRVCTHLSACVCLPRYLFIYVSNSPYILTY